MVETVLTKSQEREYRSDHIGEDGRPETIIVTIRHDDRCGNGHNTFSMTAECYSPDGHPREPKVTHKEGEKHTVLWMYGGGCQHDEITKRFPDLAPYIKWHLCSTDGPLHYIANSLYWAGKSGWCNGKPNSPPNLKHFRSTAIWPEAGEKILELCKDTLVSRLEVRLPTLMTKFQEAVESLGLTY